MFTVEIDVSAIFWMIGWFTTGLRLFVRAMVRARWRMSGRIVSAGVRGRRPTDGGVTWFSFGLRRPNRGAALLILARDFSQRIARTTRNNRLCSHEWIFFSLIATAQLLY